MEELLKKDEFSHVCTCETCLLDIASYSLNRLPAGYVASHQEKSVPGSGNLKPN